ncbi:MAG: DUF2851 family protein [Aquificaceae bacterium]
MENYFIVRGEKMTKEELLQYGAKWLELKICRMKNLLKIAEPDEALYREIMLSLGYPKNRVQFLELALITPFREIKSLKERDRIQRALLYRAGFIDSKEGLPKGFDLSLRMDKSVWNLKGIRPANHPEKRIHGISYLLAGCHSLVEFFIKRISQEEREIRNSKEAKRCVDKIMDFDGIGIERKREMFFNIILPFYLAYLENQNPKITNFLEDIFEHHPPLSENSIIKNFKFKDLITSTKTYFGALFYVKYL